MLKKTQSSDFPGTYENYDDAWNFDEFKKVSPIFKKIFS